jgi:hypothetical protein
MKTGWTFTCEWKGAIPLPPEYTFPQAFNYLNPDTNSFYILESPRGDYLQLGGSKDRCTVEHRVLRADRYDHFVLGKRDGKDGWTTIKMSQGEVTVAEREVFRHWDAIELFKRFFAGESFPDDIVPRKTEL